MKPLTEEQRRTACDAELALATKLIEFWKSESAKWQNELAQVRAQLEESEARRGIYIRDLKESAEAAQLDLAAERLTSSVQPAETETRFADCPLTTAAMRKGTQCKPDHLYTTADFSDSLERQLTSALAREKQLSAQKDYDNSEAEEAIRNHIATKNGWLCKYNEAQGELANTVKLLNARTEEYNYAVRSNQEQFKELEALTAERDEALKSRNEREAELGRLVQQMEKDDDEYEAQLTQARSELETVKRERERLLFDISEQKSNYGNAELVWSDRLNEARKHLTAAQQTITELNCKLAKYEKK